MAARIEDYDTRRRGGRSSMRELARLAQAEGRSRRKPRTDEQRVMLQAMAIAAARRRTESGELEWIGAREYRLHLEGPDSRNTRRSSLRS